MDHDHQESEVWIYISGICKIKLDYHVYFLNCLSTLSFLPTPGCNEDAEVEKKNRKIGRQTKPCYVKTENALRPGSTTPRNTNNSLGRGVHQEEMKKKKSR